MIPSLSLSHIFSLLNEEDNHRLLNVASHYQEEFQK